MSVVETDYFFAGERSFERGQESGEQLRPGEVLSEVRTVKPDGQVLSGYLILTPENSQQPTYNNPSPVAPQMPRTSPETRSTPYRTESRRRSVGRWTLVLLSPAALISAATFTVPSPATVASTMAEGAQVLYNIGNGVVEFAKDVAKVGSHL